MTVFDWIIIALASFFAVQSLVRGAIREICSLLALILAAAAAFRYYKLVLPVVQGHIASPWAQTIAAGAVVFIGVYGCVLAAGWLAALLLEKLRLGFFDKTAGLVVGVAKAYLFICCILTVLLLLPHGAEVIKQSRLSALGIPAIIRALPYFPEPVRSMVREKTAALASAPTPGR